MTNEELKKKIVEIIQSVDFYDGLLYRYCIDIATADKLADALIAAGIGDVGEWKHKAEIADRALTNTCAILYAQGVEYPYSDEEWQLQQAEKELAEGKKE